MHTTAVATTDNTEFFVGVLDGDSGTQAVETSAKFKFNPSTGATNIEGHITASGNISSSGIIFTDYLRSGDATKTLTVDTDDLYHKGTSFRTDGHITASGNISSSGDVYTEDIYLKNNLVIRYSTANSGLYVAGGIQTVGNSSFGNDVTDTHTFVGNITASSYNVSASKIITTEVSSINGLTLTGHVTASGTISASSFITDGHITASGNILSLSAVQSPYYNATTSGTGYKLSTAKALFVDSGTVVGRLSTDTIITGSTIQLGRNAIANVTASGNISASGTGSFGEIHIDPGSANQAAIKTNLGNRGYSLFVGSGSSSTQAIIYSDTAHSTLQLRSNSNSNSQITFNEDGSARYIIGTYGTDDSFQIRNSSYMTGGDQLLKLSFDGSGIQLGHDTGFHVTASGNISSSGTISGLSGYTQHNLAPTVAGIGRGDIVKFGGTTSMTAGKIYYFNSSGGWTLTNCDAVADSKGLLGVALGTSSDVDGMLLRGMVTLATIDGTNDEGLPLYLDATDGDANIAAPSTSGHVVRIIGYLLHNSNNQIWFNPDNTWIELS